MIYPPDYLINRLKLRVYLIINCPIRRRIYGCRACQRLLLVHDFLNDGAGSFSESRGSWRTIDYVRGALVFTIIDSHMKEGWKEVTGDAGVHRGKSIASGIYFRDNRRVNVREVVEGG